MEEEKVTAATEEGTLPSDGKENKKEKKGKKGKKNESPITSEASSQKRTPLGEVSPNAKYKYVIQNRKVKKMSFRRKVVIVCTVFLLVGVLVGGAVYGILNLIQYNNFRILVDQNGTNILSLSSTRDFTTGSEVLSLKGPSNMDNITFIDVLPLLPEIESNDGTYTNNKSKYLASTFYLKNITSIDRTFGEEINISEVTKNVDSAMRILVIRDDLADSRTVTVYSKGDEDGKAEEVVPGQCFTKNGVDWNAKQEDIWMTTVFESGGTVFHREGMGLPAGKVLKYTIIIWLEGWDDNCVNAILGGTVNLDINFYIS